jgi:hypothetical protein
MRKLFIISNGTKSPLLIISKIKIKTEFSFLINSILYTKYYFYTSTITKI